MRRLFIIVAGLVALASAACTVPPGNWTQYRNDPAGSGVSTSPGTISTATVSQLVQQFNGAISGSSIPSGSGTARPPGLAVSNGRVFASRDGILNTFDAGSADCGSPCQPRWRALLFGAVDNAVPVIVGSQVIVKSVKDGEGGRLEAFDANGVTGCSGAPVWCTPLWVSSPMHSFTHPVHANGRIYSLDEFGRAAAWDAAAVQNCAGTPKTCSPLWTASVYSSNGYLAVRDSTLVAVPFGPNTPVYGFDALAQQNCGGSPLVCQPLWQSAPLPGTFNGQPSIGDDRIYVPVRGDTAQAALYVYDRDGIEGCSGSPTVCEPAWKGRLPSNWGLVAFSGLAVSSGRVYLPARHSSSDARAVAVFDAAGVEGCDGTPTVCDAVWLADGGSTFTPTIANGVLFAGGKAYDAAGSISCGGSPKTCAPLWTGWSGAEGGDAVVADGRVFFASIAGSLSVYRRP